LILYSSNREYTTKASIAATALSLVSALILAPLSFTEHVKSLHPSELISAYLAVTVLLDAVQVRSLWMADVESSIAGVFTGTFATKAVLLLVESYHKTQWFKQASDQKSSPADRAGVFSRGLFLWIDSLIWKGFRHELKLDDLFPLPGGFVSESLESRLLENWENAPKTGKYSLLITMARTLKNQLIAPIIPRLCLIALTVCQPLLLIQVLAYVDAPDTPSEQNKGYGLLGAYALVYIGVAVRINWANMILALIWNLISL
jgi:ATP-binding cassette, subfamily C (CFTR/MRP), member 1